MLSVLHLRLVDQPTDNPLYIWNPEGDQHPKVLEISDAKTGSAFTLLPAK